ncbi:MAG: iron-sulfur cluster-binding protein [Bacteroidetes bacterium]|nr:MAG: iron-sulfur cluster-binding protein [Bacteroidota bacterium]
MAEIQKKFIHDANKKAFDLDHRRTIKYNMARYQESVVTGKDQFCDLELARTRAAHLKYKIINDLEKYLIEFESNFTRRGGKVIWAQDAAEAVKEIIRIAEKHKAGKVVKSKSMTSEEIDINAVLEANDINPIETDLGEYIVQLAGEKPYHIVTPVMHKSKEDIAELFYNLFDLDKNSTPEEITGFVREKLREDFITADIGITGSNFLLADTGSIALTENEGNGMLSMSFPKVHIVVAGIEKLIPSMTDLELFWPLLGSFGTGQHVTVYNSIVSGPKKNKEIDGPEEMYVVLLNNNRSELLKKERQRIALSCIRCGACLNVCPVYQNIGGHTYNTTYTGPIGSVISPFLKGMNNYKHLSFASTLCGACTEVCPVRIPLHNLLLLNRSDSVKEGHVTSNEKWSMKGMKRIMMKRKYMDMGGFGVRNYTFKKSIGNNWGPRRDLPPLAKKSFNALWKEKDS